MPSHFRPTPFLPVRRRVATAALLLLLAACGQNQQGEPDQTGMTPKAGFVTVRSGPVTLKAELPGRTTAYALAEVRPRVTGIIESRLFREGDYVEAQQALYQLDSRLLKAAVNRAEADLASAEAELENARLDYDRYTALRVQAAVSQQDLDLARAELGTRRAAVSAAGASLQTAQITLEYATIRAPIDGYIGRSIATEGALVTADQTAALTTIRQLDPIYVDLEQSYTDFQALRAEAAALRVGDDLAAAAVTLVDGAGAVYEHEGQLQFGDYAVNERTGTVTLRVLFPNPDANLLPGMFVRATIERKSESDAILVEQRAIQRDGSGAPVALVLDDDNKVSRRPVTLGEALGNQWLVTSGLAPGDRLVIDGLQQIQPGQTVEPVDMGPTVASMRPDANVEAES